MFIKSFKNALKTNNKIHLLIVGGGPLFNDLKNAIQGCRNISLVGPLYEQDLLKLILLRIFSFLPSISESWGLVINEAMAHHYLY